MSKTLKIVIGVSAVLLVLVAIGVGLIVLGFQAVKGVSGMMQASAKEVYGGPLPSHVVALMGVAVKTSKVAVFMDNNTKLTMMIVQSPEKDTKGKPLSEPDVKKSLEESGWMQHGNARTKRQFAWIAEAKPSSIHLGSKVVHVLDYKKETGEEDQVGVLNLDQGQTTFMATLPASSSDKNSIPQFLEEMPAIQHDSHLKLAQK